MNAINEERIAPDSVLGKDGQSLLEFVSLAAFACIVLFVVSLIFRDAWIQSQCAYWAFETTHARLTKRSDPRYSRGFLFLMKKAPDIQIEESDEAVQGVAKCEHFLEKVVLPQLESAEW